MRIYLMAAHAPPIDPALQALLATHNFPVLTIPFPDNGHESVRDSLANQETGVVFVPSHWQDLFCVKIIQEIRTLPAVFETVIYGPTPSISNLTVAFNEGLSAFLEMPTTAQALKLTLNRLLSKLAERAAAAKRVAELERRAAACAPNAQSLSLRDQLIARALLDIRAQRGPLVLGGARVLLVISSQVQEKRLASYLRNAGLDVERAAGVAEAIHAAKTRNYAAVVADGMLQDGTAVELSVGLRKTIKTGIPRFIVWTGSPDRAGDFYRPETYIDDVVFKPSADAGMESILLAIVAGLYQTLADSSANA